MSAHIIGRPKDELLDIILAHGADPEQAFIRGSEQGREEGDGFEDEALASSAVFIPRALRPTCRDTSTSNAGGGS